MRFVWRLVIVPVGLVLAILSAMTFLATALVLQPGFAETVAAIVERAVSIVADDLETGRLDESRFALVATVVNRGTFAIFVMPLAIVAASAELFSIRGLIAQVAATAAISALVPWLLLPNVMASAPASGAITSVFAATGAVAGFVYWLVAGRGAGGSTAISPASSGS